MKTHVGFILTVSVLVLLSSSTPTVAQGVKAETLVGWWTFEAGDELIPFLVSNATIFDGSNRGKSRFSLADKSGDATCQPIVTKPIKDSLSRTPEGGKDSGDLGFNIFKRFKDLIAHMVFDPFPQFLNWV